MNQNINNVAQDSVTIRITKKDHFPQPPFVQGEKMVVNYLGKKKTCIIMEVKQHDLYNSSLTLKPLSKIKLIRKIQVFFIRLYLKIK